MLLYGERERRPVTLRAELSRLRQLVGTLLHSRPYRLSRPVETDLDAVEKALAAGEVRSALNAYRGPLLPSSEAPGVQRLRGALADRMRSALLGARDPGLLREWSRTPWGEDDLEIWEALVDALPERSPARSAPLATAHRLRAAYGLTGSGAVGAPATSRVATFTQPPRF